MSENASAPHAPLRPVAPSSLIADKLASILRQARHRPDLDPAFVREIDEAEQLARGLEPYLTACTTSESSALRALVTDTQREDWTARFASGDTTLALESEMVSGHVEGQFLKLLVYALRATRILEIGVFTGYSALAMAEALPEAGRLVACELDPFAARFAERAFERSPHRAKIELVGGDAAESMRRLSAAGDAFDLIFIDADKGNYVNYFNLALAGSLLAPHGIICVDNTLMQGQPYLPGPPSANGRAIAEFNRVLNEDPRVEQVLLPIRDGLTLIRRI